MTQKEMPRRLPWHFLLFSRSFSYQGRTGVQYSWQ